MQPPLDIQVNGAPMQVAPGATVADLIEQLALGGRKVAVAVNRAVVPRSRFTEHGIAAADRIEILEAVGGG